MIRVRKNVTSLTVAERATLVQAILKIKQSGAYDPYVLMHNNAMMRLTPWPGHTETSGMTFRNAAHSGPSFYPWHREFILRFEKDLQAALSDPTFSLPYWDWAADSGLPDPKIATVWGSDLMGGNGAGANSEVGTGPFRSVATGGTWTVVNSSGAPAGALQRQFGSDIPTLPTLTDVSTTNAITPYDADNWSRDSTTGMRVFGEGWAPTPNGGMHNHIHRWVGGSMQPGTSPNDPIFFLHHCNVDRQWNTWQQQNPGQGYLPVSGGPPGHNLNDALWPWNTAADMRTPSDLINSVVLGYKYDTDP